MSTLSLSRLAPYMYMHPFGKTGKRGAGEIDNNVPNPLAWVDLIGPPLGRSCRVATSAKAVDGSASLFCFFVSLDLLPFSKPPRNFSTARAKEAPALRSGWCSPDQKSSNAMRRVAIGGNISQIERSKKTKMIGLCNLSWKPSEC